MHLFWAPHLDDAVLSCGATIYQLVQAGERVQVLTTMAGDPPQTLPDSPLIDELHQRWGVGANPVAARRAEDQAAVESLGAAAAYLSYLDCIYRTDAAGRALYASGEALFAAVHPDDSLQALASAPEIPVGTQTLYVPLAVGNHVDHQIVCGWLLRQARTASLRCNVKVYADYPYSRDTLELESRLATVSSGLAAQQLRLHAEPQPLTDAAVTAKIRAIEYYSSQISTFWEDAGAMAQAVRRDLTRTGTAEELYWTPVHAG